MKPLLQHHIHRRRIALYPARRADRAGAQDAEAKHAGDHATGECTSERRLARDDICAIGCDVLFGEVEIGRRSSECRRPNRRKVALGLATIATRMRRLRLHSVDLRRADRRPIVRADRHGQDAGHRVCVRAGKRSAALEARADGRFHECCGVRTCVRLPARVNVSRARASAQESCSEQQIRSHG